MSYDLTLRYDLSPSLTKALLALSRFDVDKPMREIAKGQSCTTQAMACRVFRLRELGLALKTGPERYTLTPAGYLLAKELKEK